MENLSANANNFIYVVFSKTPYKMGKFIRSVTHAQYNHVSISFDAELNEMYSFARFYNSTPFYGGFVRESLQRYVYNGSYSEVLICKIPISLTQLFKAKEFVSQIGKSGDYRYNMFSAVTYPLKRRVKIKKAYTCVEFAVDLLEKIGVSIKCEKNGFCSTDELAKELDDKKFFYGDISRFLDKSSFFDCEYNAKKSVYERMKLTVGSNLSLIKMFFVRKA